MGEDCCRRSWRRIIPEVSPERQNPTCLPRLSRKNGWSKPLNSFQVAAWVMCLILAFTSFAIFIPFLPNEWKYIAYGVTVCVRDAVKDEVILGKMGQHRLADSFLWVTGGLFFLHFITHLIATSLDPAEASVRLKKNYSEPLQAFDRSKHQHVIENEYCHLCRVPVTRKANHCNACNKCVSGFDHHCKWLNNCVGSRNYWYFFCSVASASAGLLCLVVIMLYVFVQYFADPEELRTDAHYEKISKKNTWLLFLPSLPVKTKTPVVLGIGMFVLLLAIFCLLMFGRLFVFHVYLRYKRLSTYDYMTKDCLQDTSKAGQGQKGPSIALEMPKEAEGPSPPPPSKKKQKRFPRLPRGLCATNTVHPQKPSSPKEAEGPSPPPPSKKKQKRFPRLPRGLCATNTVHPQKPSSPKETVVELSSSSSGVISEEFLPSAKDPRPPCVVAILPEDSLLLLKAARTKQRPPIPGRMKLKFLPPLPTISEHSSLTSESASTSESTPSLEDQQGIRQPVEEDSSDSEVLAAEAGEPMLTRQSIGEPSSSEIPPRELTIGNFLLPCALPRSRVPPKRPRDGFRGSQKALKALGMHSTTIDIDNEPEEQQALQEVCHIQHDQPPEPTQEAALGEAAPCTQVAESLPSAVGETRIDMGPDLSVENGCSSGEAAEPPGGSPPQSQ